jgi:hypothetical protein
MRDIGEPLSRGQVDRRAAEARALRDALFGVALFTGVVLVNGILAILFIALMQALGLWGTAADGASLDGIDEMRLRLHALVDPTGIQSLDG